MRYGSMDYGSPAIARQVGEIRDLLVNGEPVDAFSTIVLRTRRGEGRQLQPVERSDSAPALSNRDQAAIGGKSVRRVFHYEKRDCEVLWRRYHGNEIA
jgi:translation elongation factor EF-4